jgi:hypothetical protein
LADISSQIASSSVTPPGDKLHLQKEMPPYKDFAKLYGLEKRGTVARWTVKRALGMRAPPRPPPPPKI